MFLQFQHASVFEVHEIWLNCIMRAWCTTIVTCFINYGSYTSLAPSPRLFISVVIMCPARYYICVQYVIMYFVPGVVIFVCNMTLCTLCSMSFCTLCNMSLCILCNMYFVHDHVF